MDKFSKILDSDITKFYYFCVIAATERPNGEASSENTLEQIQPQMSSKVFQMKTNVKALKEYDTILSTVDGE